MTFSGGFALGLSLLLVASCSEDRSETGADSGAGPAVSDRCDPEKGYCEGNTAYHCGNDKHPFDWESEPCAADEVCIKGDCLTEPLETCSEFGATDCSRDGQRVGSCVHSGYYYWLQLCDVTLGETCLPAYPEIPSMVGCVVPSMGNCSSSDSTLCRENQAYFCASRYWQIDGICDPARGETCFASHDAQGNPWIGCILESLGPCSSSNGRGLCQGDFAYSCSTFGYWARNTTCSRSGFTCRDGYCSKAR